MSKRKNDIQCQTCGGRMKKKKLGYDCLNCDNFLNHNQEK